MSATSITVRVPMAIGKRGGRKIMLAPDGSVVPSTSRHLTTPSDPALVKTLTRAFRYQRLLDSGKYSWISEVAVAEEPDRRCLGACSISPSWHPTSPTRRG